MPYTDLPATRMAWDVDGTVFRYRSIGSVWSTRSQSDMNNMNDEDSNELFGPESFTSNGQTAVYAWIFPETRTITHWAAFWTSLSPTWTLQYSLDSTDGSDGTWTTVGNLSLNAVAAAQPYYRSTINAVTVNSGNPVKAIRFNYLTTSNSTQTPGCYYMHWYGSKSSHAGLVYWDPTSNVIAPPTFLDFQDVNQGGTYTKTFRVKNNHGSLTANGIVLSAVDVSGSATLQFSDGGAYSSSLNIGNLASGAISSVITARRIVPSNETVRLQSMRVSAVPTSWS